MAIYLSMHIIACMTRQALNQLIATMQAAPEIRFIRAGASQMMLTVFLKHDQSRPPFHEINRPSSVPAKSRSLRTSSSRTTRVNAFAGRPLLIRVQVFP